MVSAPSGVTPKPVYSHLDRAFMLTGLAYSVGGYYHVTVGRPSTTSLPSLERKPQALNPKNFNYSRHPRKRVPSECSV